MGFYWCLPYAGPLLFMALLFSSLTAAGRMVQTKSTGKIPFFPIASLFLSSFVWTLYGVLRHDASLYISNGVGIVVSLVCIGVFHLYSTSRPWGTYWTLLLSSIIVMLLIQAHLDVIVGWIACALSVVLSGSPLVVISTVIKERSTAALPFSISFINWLSNISWMCYGYLVVNDVIIYAPSILGFALTSIQLALFLIYGFTPEKSETEKINNV